MNVTINLYDFLLKTKQNPCIWTDKLYAKIQPDAILNVQDIKHALKLSF